MEWHTDDNFNKKIGVLPTVNLQFFFNNEECFESKV